MRQLAKATSRTPPSEEDSPFEYIDRSLTILGRTSDTHGERMRQEFLVQREFIATQIKEVEKRMDGRFEEVEKKMDGRFKEVDRRFEEVEKKMDGRFKEVDRRFEEVENRIRARFDQIQNVLRNSLRTRGWEAISPVGSLGPRGGIHFPEVFPRTIMQFWKLKETRQSKLLAPSFTGIIGLINETVDRLVRLISFYNIQGYEDWGRDTDSLENSSQESSQSSRLPISLEVAVRSNPEIAHRVLGGQLGLAYDKIQKFMDRAEELSQARVISQKRAQDEQAFEDRKKRSFKMSPEGTEVTSPTEPRSSQGRPE